MAYPGCYALSKVLEEVMVEQYGIQYGIDWCCLRAPWIMEKDDFRHTLSFGDDLFGGPDWKTMVSPEADAAACRESGAVPLLQEEDGTPVKRNFVHVDDLSSAILLALDIAAPRGSGSTISAWTSRSITARSPPIWRGRAACRSTTSEPFLCQQLDGQQPRQGSSSAGEPPYDLEKLIESAWDYERPADDPRRSLVSGLISETAGLPLDACQNGRNDMKKDCYWLAAAASVVCSPDRRMAQKKTLAIVVKGLDNPFFEQINGCQKWNEENADSEYKCLYTGPALSSDEAGEVQIVDDLLTRPDVAGIAISPSNAPAMANMLKAKAPKIPVMTIDADLAGRRSRACARPISAPTTTDGRQVGRAPARS